jgi:hypothetical protein
MESHGDEEDTLGTIYREAQVMRKSIANFTKAAKDTDIIEVTSDIHDVPAELYIMIGPAESMETQRRTKVVDRAALTVSQNIMYGFKSKRQVNYKPRMESIAFRPSHARGNPQVLGLALALHHDTRSKMLMDLLGAQDYCVPYGRILLIETTLANAVVKHA